MTRLSRKNARYLTVLFLVGMLSLWGCPKKTEVTSAPEVQAPAAENQKELQQRSAKAAEESTTGESGKTGKETAGASLEGLRAVYYDFDESFIRADAREVMRANAEWLKSHPQSKIKIEGNCDEKGTKEYNQALGQRRAGSAKKYLTDMGVSGSRISLISYGKEKPVCTESADSCWQKNRRADFVVTNE